MGEDFDPLTTENTASLISNKGIVIVMLGLIAIGAIAGFTFAGNRGGAGVLMGGILAVINYLWLRHSTRALFAHRASSSVTLLAAKYVLRYVALGAVLVLVHLSGAVPIGAVIAGLSAFAVAVVLTGLKNIFTSAF